MPPPPLFLPFCTWHYNQQNRYLLARKSRVIDWQTAWATTHERSLAITPHGRGKTACWIDQRWAIAAEPSENEDVASTPVYVALPILSKSLEFVRRPGCATQRGQVRRAASEVYAPKLRLHFSPVPLNHMVSPWPPPPIASSLLLLFRQPADILSPSLMRE
ncbi:uncharacterized protein CLUP02_09620 [Colletotrichum lupini]|uniref:Uncharacterized protein n=1 Tax=Colletotrichum lupini TaxID=145971 RepID=A0A9Q8SV71_9PEZI|nr:uncharacterized protein CLUP02_09620 [Colletotrichum lupini]UQC84124.1 hypothetical protein CLUP02_09620 [Colletotrichum lupini]